MKTLKLRNSPLLAVIDDEDYDKCIKHNWYLVKKKHGKHISISTTINRKLLGLSIFLLGSKEGYHIDHKDRDGLNNQKSNLRHITQKDNNRNIGIKGNNTSGYIGVSWHKKSQRYQVQIYHNKKRVYLGTYNSKEEGAKIYDSAIKYHYKEFGVLNFPDDGTITPKSIEMIRKEFI